MNFNKYTYWIFLLAILLLTSIITTNSFGQLVNFEKIESPIIFEGNYKYAYRDPAVIYHNNIFYLYFTLVERASDNGMYLYTAFSKSNDLIHWTFPQKITPKDRTLNYSSPGNIIKFNNEWIICLQTYPQPNFETWGNKDSRIWIMRSSNLENWGDAELLKVKGNKIPNEKMGRMIDPYLLNDPNEQNKWWCYYKQNGVSMSYSYDLKNWTYYGTAMSGENVSVLYKNEEFILFHSPENGIGVKHSKTPTDWGEDKQLLTLGQENWGWAKRRLTAATVIDLSMHNNIGKYIMFFHGSSIEGARPKYNAHNNASLAIAWSDDLIEWTWPGKNKKAN